MVNRAKTVTISIAPSWNMTALKTTLAALATHTQCTETKRTVEVASKSHRHHTNTPLELATPTSPTNAQEMTPPLQARKLVSAHAKQATILASEQSRRF